ncbi:MAG: transketolase, partial [Vicinamibacteria bacterium]
MSSEKFPIDLSALKPLKLDPRVPALTAEQRAILVDNVQLCRDAIVFFTALAGAKGLSGHTGGAF